MKTKKFILPIAFLLLGMIFIDSCVKENWEYPEELKHNVNYADSTNYKIISIKDLKALHDGDTTKLNDSLVIVCTVISNDASGNIYKELYLQDSTGGIVLQMDMNPISAEYPVGQKLAIKCGGLYIDNVKGLIKLGFFTWNDTQWSFGRLQGYDNFDKHLIKIDGGKPVTPKTYKMSQLGDSLLMTLIKIDSVQFQTPNKPYEGSMNIIDKRGAYIVMYNSPFSTFAKKIVSDKSGSVICIYSKYWETKQIYIRDTTDLTLTEPRF